MEQKVYLCNVPQKAPKAAACCGCAPEVQMSAKRRRVGEGEREREREGKAKGEQASWREHNSNNETKHLLCRATAKALRGCDFYFN